MEKIVRFVKTDVPKVSFFSEAQREFYSHFSRFIHLKKKKSVLEMCTKAHQANAGFVKIGGVTAILYFTCAVDFFPWLPHLLS
jgi:hypothetical protein